MTEIQYGADLQQLWPGYVKKTIQTLQAGTGEMWSGGGWARVGQAKKCLVELEYFYIENNKEICISSVSRSNSQDNNNNVFHDKQKRQWLIKIKVLYEIHFIESVTAINSLYIEIHIQTDQLIMPEIGLNYDLHLLASRANACLMTTDSS